MKMFKLLIFNKYLIVAAMLFGNLSNVFASGLVTVVKSRPLDSIIELSLEAEVLNKISEFSGRASYRLYLELPTGINPAFGIGSFVKVNVPTIHQTVVGAQVISLSKNRAYIVLSNQVQQLEGQKLKVELPVRPASLFKIPFQSIISPRGNTFEVFILTPDMKVRSVQVTPIQTSSDGDVIVSSEHLKNTSIVVRGTDNLLSGDSVQVNKEAGALL